MCWQPPHAPLGSRNYKSYFQIFDLIINFFSIISQIIQLYLTEEKMSKFQESTKIVAPPFEKNSSLVLSKRKD